MITSNWETITPEIAAAWLAKMKKKRALRKVRVDAYARDMAAGKWLESGEAIKFDFNDELIDGMHRLSALVQAGVDNPDLKVRMLVLRGVHPDVIDVIDSGAGRSFADLLSIRGETPAVAQTLGTLTRRIYLWDEEGMKLQIGGPITVTHQELDGFLTCHDELRDHARHATGSRHHPLTVPASLFAAFLTLTSRIDTEKAYYFGQRWIDGINLQERDPILVLRKRLEADRLAYDPVSSQWVNEIKLALAFIAWNLFRKNRRVDKLQLPANGLTNSNYPVPK